MGFTCFVGVLRVAPRLGGELDSWVKKGGGSGIINGIKLRARSCLERFKDNQKN
jgi:hypothetical protein